MFGGVFLLLGQHLHRQPRKHCCHCYKPDCGNHGPINLQPAHRWVDYHREVPTNLPNRLDLLRSIPWRNRPNRAVTDRDNCVGMGRAVYHTQQTTTAACIMKSPVCCKQVCIIKMTTITSPNHMPVGSTTAMLDKLTSHGLRPTPNVQLRRWRYRAVPIRVVQVFQRRVAAVQPNENV